MSKFNMGDYFKYKSKHYDVLARLWNDNANPR